MMPLTDADMPIRQGELSCYQGHMGNTITPFALPFGICKDSMQKKEFIGFSFEHSLIKSVN